VSTRRSRDVGQLPVRRGPRSTNSGRRDEGDTCRRGDHAALSVHMAMLGSCASTPELLGQVGDAGAKGRVGRDTTGQGQSPSRGDARAHCAASKQLLGDGGLERSPRRRRSAGPVALGRANDRGLPVPKRRGRSRRRSSILEVSAKSRYTGRAKVVDLRPAGVNPARATAPPCPTLTGRVVDRLT